MPIIRIDKMLSGQGLGSRREIKNLIRAGAVKLNGLAVTNADTKIDALSDQVTVEGRDIAFQEHIYIMMNKPKGVLSASSAPQGRTVLDLLPQDFRRPGLFPAGRLDKDTEGLLIITDDGGFAHNILSPRKHVDKTYFAQIDSPADAADVARFEEGVLIDGGYTCLPAKLEILKAGPQAEVLIIISEGKYHQIKRMFEALHKKVVYLKRIAVGGLRLDTGLAPGQSRLIGPDELVNINNLQKK